MALAALGAVMSLGGPASGARAATVFDIQGAGNGHGIGMSQFGAYGYAQQGFGYRFILAHYYQGTAIGSTNPDQLVRVLLSTGVASFSGATSAVPAGSAPVTLAAGTTYDVTALSDGDLQVASAAGATVGTFAPPLSVSGPGPVDVPGKGEYRGALEFRPDGAGGVQTVNAVGLDDYVRGVVSIEMSASGWPAAALEAQAVAARTYAITTTVHGNGYTLYSDTRSQGYGGVAAETPSTDAAVAATTGQVVTYDGKPVVTYYFSSSGGYTESIQNVWPGATPEPWLVGVSDPFDAADGDPYHSWDLQLSLTAAGADLGSLVDGTLEGIVVTRHGVSPRIITAEVVGTGGDTSVTGSQLQSALDLRSTWASFTTISSTADGDALSASLFPVPPAGSTVALQSLGASGAWQTLGQESVSASGAVSVALSGPGSYRILDGSMAGPAVVVGVTPAARGRRAHPGVTPAARGRRAHPG